MRKAALQILRKTLLQRCLWLQRTWFSGLEAARKLKIRIRSGWRWLPLTTIPLPYLSPSITAVKQPIHELGRAAVEMLLR